MKSWKTRAWESDDFLVSIATLSASIWLTCLDRFLLSHVLDLILVMIGLVKIVSISRRGDGE
jgi:hypothetical protein